MNRYLILIIAVGYIIVIRGTIARTKKKLGSSKAPAKKTAKAPMRRKGLLSIFDPEEKKVFVWGDNGEKRRLAHADIEVPETETEETDEFPGSLEELFEGLGEEEISGILDEVLDADTEKTEDEQ